LPNYLSFLTRPILIDVDDAVRKRVANTALETLMLSSFFPFAVAIYFFYRSSEARTQWRMLLGENSLADDSVFSEDEYDSETDRDTDAGSKSSTGAVQPSAGNMCGDVFNPTHLN
jgi:hypothetical protein